MFIPFETAVQIARANIARHRAAMAELNASVRPTQTTPAPRSVAITKKVTGYTVQTSGKARFAEQLSREEEAGGRFCKWNGGRKSKGKKPARITIRGAFIN